MLTRILSITLSTKAAKRSNKLNPPKLLLVAKEGFFMSKVWQSSFCFLLGVTRHWRVRHSGLHDSFPHSLTQTSSAHISCKKS